MVGVSGSGLAKAESIFHKIFDRSVKTGGGINSWSRSTKFENNVEFVTFILWNSTVFLRPMYFLWNRICEFRFRKHSIGDFIFLPEILIYYPTEAKTLPS